jgi:glycosyltransferase involved in cell wall biosynthesis
VGQFGLFDGGESKERLDWEAFVAFHGIEWVPSALPHEIPAHYARAGVYLSTSQSEGMSLTAVQALAAGMPIVTTAAGQEEFVPGACPQDAGALADAVCAALEMPAEERGRLLAEYRARAQRFDVRWWAARYADVLREAAREGVPAAAWRGRG